MIRISPFRNNHSLVDQVQIRLLLLAALIVVTYALTLSLSPLVRYHGNAEEDLLAHWTGVIFWIASFVLLHYQTAKKLPRRDPIILPVVALLSGLGLMTIWRLYPQMGLRQMVWIVIASIVVFLGLQYPIFMNYLRKYKYIWLLMGLLLTGLTIFLGSNPSGNGPALWLEFLGIHFQPSEFLKILLITYLASFFTDRLVVVYRKFNILLPTLFVIGSALILLVVQRDLGTAVIFLLIYLGIIFSTKGNKLTLLGIFAAFFAILILSYHYIEIVRMRFDTWVNPFSDPSGASYQIMQSIIGIAEGSLIGTGPGLGSPSLVPVSVSDFIYAAVTEELGFLGGLFIISLFIILIYRGIKLVSVSKHSFDRYLSLGIVFYFGIQSILIIGGNIGMLPLTGVTLPFVSYGGSSLVTSFIAMLFLIIISNRSRSDTSVCTVNQRRQIVLCGILIFLLVLEIIVTSLESYWFSSKLTNRPENPRWVIDDRFSQRGEILDRDNQVIITNSGEIGSYQRESNHIPLYPVIGYTNAIYGQTGIENIMFPYLRGYQGYAHSAIFWNDLLYNQPPEGLDIRLTIDLELQIMADDLLGDESGAIVLMNAQSGEILSIASHPYYDAKFLEQNWESLVNDESAPLLNRATQGLYPPGSTLFPFIATAQAELIKRNDQPDSIIDGSLDLHTCVIFPGADLTWKSVITNGCQGIQAKLAEIIGMNSLLDLFQDLNFFNSPNIRLNVAQTDSLEITDPEAFYRGEGTFTISPLQLALAASALTNQGVLPAPKIVNAYQDPQGNWITLQKLDEASQVLEEDSANWMINMIKMLESPYWQITSTASTEEDQQITWYLAGTTPNWQGQPTVVVVLLERNAPDLAQNLGITLLEETIQFSSNN